MKNLPIHENLDSSFVNLSALVRYLRSRQFVGSIRFELDGYEADITLGAENQLKVLEHDRVAGRIAEGEEAFQRLLIRARAPGGAINVYQLIEETKTAAPKIELVAEKSNIKLFVQKEISAPMTVANGAAKKEENKYAAPVNVKESVLPAIKPIPLSKEPALPPKNSQPPAAPPAKNNAPLPLEFSNRVEEKARQTQMTPQDWQTFLGLTAELLGAIDKTLAAADLDFSTAFAKACAEISNDYPFLNPASGIFAYSKGSITMREQPSAKLFAASINESLRRILEKLGAHPKFAEVYRDTVQAILALVHQRKPLYDKFFITPQLEKNLGA